MWFLLALSVVILDEVLQQVHPLFGFDLIHLDEVLLDGETSTGLTTHTS